MKGGNLDKAGYLILVLLVAAVVYITGAGTYAERNRDAINANRIGGGQVAGPELPLFSQLQGVLGN